MDTKLTDKVKKHLRMFSNPVILLDKEVKCVYCNRKNFCKAGTSLAKCFQKSFKLPEGEIEETLMIFKGKSYCARIIPFIEELYICEMVTSDSVMKMAERTDIYAELSPLLVNADNNVEFAWKRLGEIENRLHEDKQADYMESVVTLEKPILVIDKTIKNFTEYTNLCLRNSQNEVIEVREFLIDLQGRWNNSLKQIGRHIEILDTIDMLCISANKRHVLYAMMNAIQNAVYYSPKDTAPVMTFYKEREEETGKRMVVIQITNDTIFRESEDGEYEFNFVQTGLGIPIIKRFAEDAGGKINIETINGRYRLCVKLPEYMPEIDRGYQFNCFEGIQYSSEELGAIGVFTRETLLVCGEICKSFT